MRQSKKPVTASDLAVRQQADPIFVARRQEFEKRRQTLISQHRLGASPIINDLKNAGFPVESIDELRRGGIPYRRAVPILLRWLPTISDLTVKESVVRALSVPWARSIAARPLIAEFRRAPEAGSSGLKWAIGSALEIVANDAVFNDIAELVRQKRHGKSREMLAVTLGNMKNRGAVDVLIELLDDEEVAGHAVMGLGKLKEQRARPYLERFLNHPEHWVRKEAAKALAKLNK